MKVVNFHYLCKRPSKLSETIFYTLKTKIKSKIEHPVADVLVPDVAAETGRRLRCVS